MKIVNFGSCNIDYVYSLDHIVNVGETETTYKLETFAGGKGLNQSIALARAGAKVYHAGCIGEGGELLRDIMLSSGVDLSYIKNTSTKNGHAIIQLSAKGENSIFIYPGSNGEVSVDYIDTVLTDFEKGDILLLQNEISNVNYVIEKAYEKQMCIILNPSPFNEKITEIDFKKLSYVILNEIEAKQISKTNTTQEAVEFFKANYPELKVMLTLGGKGSVYFDKENNIVQSAYSVKAVDTTGAGDTFTGYFIAGISKNENYGEILKKSSAASAIAVSRMGAAPSIPKMDEVEKFIVE